MGLSGVLEYVELSSPRMSGDRVRCGTGTPQSKRRRPDGNEDAIN